MYKIELSNSSVLPPIWTNEIDSQREITVGMNRLKFEVFSKINLIENVYSWQFCAHVDEKTSSVDTHHSRFCISACHVQKVYTTTQTLIFWILTLD